MKLALEIILLAVVVNALILDKVLTSMPPKELKRRARAVGDNRAANIHKMTSYGPTLALFLWIQGVLAGFGLFLLFKNSWVITLMLVLATAYAIYFWHPPIKRDGRMWAWAASIAPGISKLMSYLQPILIQANRLIPSRATENTSGVYEKEDLLEFISAQNTRNENRISEHELKMAFNALTFGDKDVGAVMTPLRKVKLVTQDEQVGPLLMDELHSSGFSRFPVVADNKNKANPQIVGTLYLKNLIGHTGEAKVSHLMDKKVYFVNETQSLNWALDAFLKTHHHLFIVVNSFEEMVGVISVEDILEQIIGSEIIDEFDKYDDLRAVASLEATKEHNRRDKAHPIESNPEQQP